MTTFADDFTSSKEGIVMRVFTMRRHTERLVKHNRRLEKRIRFVFSLHAVECFSNRLTFDIGSVRTGCSSSWFPIGAKSEVKAGQSGHVMITLPFNSFWSTRLLS